ncbi:hypothetical protein LCGC14_2280460 [marine sediment metagenome]|uniref:Uncharacterized protein n=1 Tax=marine sediment metagenome TaxID=412755 RepID=A0A0F9F6R5_9ZZZZ
MARWTTSIELFGPGPAKKNRWVLRDPTGIIRAVFRGLGSDAPQRALAKHIAALLNKDAYLFKENSQQ